MQRKLIAHSWDFDGMLASPLYVEKRGEIVSQAAKEKALPHPSRLSFYWLIISLTNTAISLMSDSTSFER